MDLHLSDPAKYPYVYMTASSGGLNPVRARVYMCAIFPHSYVPSMQWVERDLVMFQKRKSFFIVDPAQQQGIHCRFGMPGVIAEAHYDSGRNCLAVVNGTRRYIISPPESCNDLFILKSGPSARHSEADWSDPSIIPKLANAKAFEVSSVSFCCFSACLSFVMLSRW